MEPLIVREQHLQSLTSFSVNLARVLPDDPSSEQIKELETALQAECVQCGIQVGGGDLFQLAEAARSEDATSKCGRLRFGYCARKGCNSYFYRLKFYAHPLFDWPNLLAQAERVGLEQLPEEIAALALIYEQRKEQRKKMTMVSCSFAAAVIAGMMLFQWYNGGTIPLLREPERFKVDPRPEVVNTED
ncbi:MAG: hypothetical protein ACK4UN_21900 [Limisphaerales bacterium]